MNRRPHLILVGLIVAALIGVALLAIPGIAAPRQADARARPPGRARGDAEGGPAAEPPAAEVRPRPLGGDPPRPRRPARRRGAGDPQAGRRPDRDRPARRQGPGPRDRHPRPDRAARALRPRGQPGAAVELRRLRRAEGVALRAPGGPAGPRRRGHEDELVPVRREQEAGRRPGHRARQAARERGGRRGGREGRRAAEGLEDLRRPAEDGRRHLRCRRGRLPGRERREPEAELLLPLQLRPGQCGSEQGRPRDDRRRPEAGRHAAGLRHARPASRS